MSSDASRVGPVLAPPPPGQRRMSPSDLEAATLAEFPELRRLIDLREAGWVFLPGLEDGEITEVRGVRTWPDGWGDAIRVRYTTDTAALRTDHDGGLVWQREGSLVEVVDGLLTLPPPSEPGAARLVRATEPMLWIRNHGPVRLQGAVRWIKDQFAGLPSEVNVFYEQAR